ncbi:MAG: 50S ribosomal protein L30e, partial [Methanobacteriota archaeon]
IEMDVGKSIRAAVDTGKVILGERETLRAVRNGEVRLVIMASNCPSALKEKLMHHAKILSVHVYEYPGSSLELGSACGKPFTVSILGVVEAGDSDIFELCRR